MRDEEEEERWAVPLVKPGAKSGGVGGRTVGRLDGMDGRPPPPPADPEPELEWEPAPAPAPPTQGPVDPPPPRAPEPEPEEEAIQAPPASFSSPQGSALNVHLGPRGCVAEDQKFAANVLWRGIPDGLEYVRRQGMYSSRWGSTSGWASESELELEGSNQVEGAEGGIRREA